MKLRSLVLALLGMFLLGACDSGSSRTPGSSVPPPDPKQVMQAPDPRPTITDLGPTGQGGFNPVGISDAGVVAGGTIFGGRDALGIPNVIGAAIWQSGKISNLPGLNGATAGYTSVSSISPGGIIAGSSAPNQSTDLQPWHAVTWKDGQVSDLGGPPGFPKAMATNDRGDSVGFVLQGQACPAPSTPLSWIGGTYAQLPGTTNAVPVAINNRRQIIGNQFKGPNFVGSDCWASTEAVLWDNGTIKNLSQTFPGFVASAINDGGQVVGSKSGSAFAFNLTNDNGVDVGRFASVAHSSARAINARGAVVGVLNDDGHGHPADSSRAFFWTAGSTEVIDLNSLLPANSGWVLQDAAGINANDQVVGTGKLSGQSHGFILNLMPIIGQYRTYVALGDSYSSGLGTGPGDYQTRNDGVPYICESSVNAYPWKVAGHPGVPKGTFGPYACAGERADDVVRYSATTQGELPQLLRVGPDTRLVTFTFGGIDTGFADVGRTCIESNVGHPFKLTQLNYWCFAKDSAVMDAIQKLQEVLFNLYTEIHERAPKARILVLEYPYVFPTNHPTKFVCKFAEGANQETVDWFNSKTNDLNGTIKQEVKIAAGSEYVDTSTTFTRSGHDLCSDHPWANGLASIPLVTAFHPNKDGHQALANDVLWYLKTRQQPK